MSKGNNVSKGVTMKKALKGIAGTFLALPFLIGMGSLYIANMVRFAVKKEEDIYVYELNKLLQSSNVNDKKRIISYLNEILYNNDKHTAEYEVAKNYLNKDIMPLYKCLTSIDEDLKNNTKALLINMLKSKNQDIKNIAERIVRCYLGSDNNNLSDDAKTLLISMFKDENPDIKTAAERIIKSCFGARNFRLKANSITLLTEMFKSTNINMKNAAKGIVSSKDCEVWLRSDDFRLKSSLVSLFTTMLKNEEIIGTVEKIVKECLESNDIKLKANTIALLAEMLKDENTGEYEVAKTLLNKNDKLIDKIQDGLSKMLDNEDTKGNAIKILKNAFEGATQNEEDMRGKEIPHKKGFLVKNLDDLEVIEKDSSIELLLKKMFDKNETKGLAIKVINYLESKNLYSDELREYFSEKNKNDNVEVLDQEEVF